jgi:hypothetical protein
MSSLFVEFLRDARGRDGQAERDHRRLLLRCGGALTSEEISSSVWQFVDSVGRL